MISKRKLKSDLARFDPYPALDEFIAGHLLLDSSKISSCTGAYEFYVVWAKENKHHYVTYAKFKKRVAKCLSVEIVKVRCSSKWNVISSDHFCGVVLTVKSRG